VESIASIPVLTSHYGFTDAQLAEAGVSRGMLRVSVGLEDAGDILADLREAVA
jgi:cystathionine beta-lyase/cystathionine gamma-synthase